MVILVRCYELVYSQHLGRVMTLASDVTVVVYLVTINAPQEPATSVFVVKIVAEYSSEWLTEHGDGTQKIGVQSLRR